MKDILIKIFKREVRGYNKDEVNEFLDDVTKTMKPGAACEANYAEENRPPVVLSCTGTPQHLRLLALLMQEFPQVDNSDEL